MQGGYLEVSQAEQEATSTDKPISNHPKNISEKGYRCVCLNARSIVNKKNELTIMVEDIDPHIIGITESWANIDITDAELGLTGYVMFRKDRIGRRGGGVILYVKESIQAYEIKLEREADCDEAVWCKIVSGNSKLTIGLIYRSPNINEEDNTKIKNAIKEVSKGECIIMGDFNHGHIQWNSLESTGIEDQQFLCLIQDSFLTQHVLEPTRGENVLDIVLSSQKELVDNVKMFEPKAKYKEALNAATTEIRQSKRSYEQKLACNIKNDSKSFYAYVRSKQNVQDKVGPLEDSAGNIISQGFLMAEDLNGYFSSVFTKEDVSSLPVADAKFQGAKSDYLGPLVVTPELVAKKIKAMKDNKSPGVDGIPPKLLMETVDQISIPLARVFNLSLKEGVVPFEWKEANIIPLFKKGSRNKSENYRPVSLTSVICKLLERLIKDHMVDFLVKHKLLNSSQHGFLKARSCLTNMLCFLEEITKWIDVGSPVDIIYLDFQKAFDKVPHQRLLLKLKAHGIGDSITDWIEQWLTDRRQRVVVDGEVSNWKSVLSGVPQGSVLGPILFLIYINDLDDSITSNVLKFADDTKLFRKVNTDGDKQHLQNDLDRLVKWSEKWQMLFNFGKCKCLHTGHGNLNVNYKMGDTVLGTTVKEKDLGVTISADMKVSEQCGIAASKGNQILGLIRRNITYKGKKLIIPLYKAIVRPHLEYCIQAWRPYRKKDIDTLERIQRRATKMIPELRDLSYEERLKECGLTTLETRRLRGDQIEVFKILNGYENIDRNMFFSLKKDSRTRGHEVKLVKDQCRLDIRKHSFSQRTINEWNKLSTDCVTASSVNMFKNKVDTYIRRAGYK